MPEPDTPADWRRRLSVDAAFALVLPLVGGFFVVREARFIKYQAAREDGHRLYFRIAYYGFWLFLWSSLQALSEAASQNELEGLLIDAVAEAKSVLVTLTTGKAYVGFVLSNPQPGSERRVIALLPLASGYRSSTNEPVLTTFYDQIYSKSDTADREDFRLVLSLDKIVSAAFFDFEIYERFNAARAANSQKGH